MIGFIIENNGLSLKLGSEGIYVIFGMLKSSDQTEISMDIRGSNDFFEERLNWGSWKLKRGDEFRIKVVEVDEITEPREKEIKKVPKEQLNEELATYLSLKVELEKENLL
ncbi:hypothetical protein [Algoriphagus namhaensis]